MLISPPFIPEPIANESDEAFVARSMPGGEPGNGSFPLSYDLGWHGGMHISAPMAAGNILPVRAIADGVVAYFRQPEPVSGNPEHPLNYRGGWTDNGCLVLRHETEIGEGPEASVVFYSIYMHLSSITLENPQQGQQIYRKDSIGLAGRIYGQPNKIHFEIISSQEQVARLTGRSTTELNLAAKGRTDSCWGDMHFYIPPEVLFYAERPANPRDTNNISEIVHRPPEAYFVKMNYQQGQCTLKTFSELGEQQGLHQEENDYEYNLYRTASTLYPQCISAGYELLRFGRVLGPDRLQPADAAHWRQIAYPGGVGWVNLNSLTVTQYSDADFPHWLGWKLIDDDVDGDSRCQSQRILNLIGLAAPPATVDQRTVAQTVLSNADSQQKTKRLTCHFPTEWRRAGIDSRYAWLIAGESPILTQESFGRLRSHLEALAFWEDAALEGISESHWHYSPKQFIEVFRKCSWLNLREFSYTLPKYHFYERSGTAYVAHTEGPARIYQISNETAIRRFQAHYSNMNKIMLKYGMTSAKRRSHFLSQTILETDRWRTLSEYGSGQPNDNIPMAQYYAAFYGRGIMQLTWAGNYEKYGTYRSATSLPAQNGQYTDARISNQSTHYWEDPTERDRNNRIIRVAGIPRRWSPRYDPDLIRSDSYNACDSGGFYWVSKNIGQRQSNINRTCDLEFAPERIGRVSTLVNGGGNGYMERQAYASFTYRYFSESLDNTVSGVVETPRGQITVNYSVSRPE